MKIIILVSMSAFFSVSAAQSLAKAGETGYAVSHTFDVGGEGGWDYVTVDSEHGLIFLPRTTHTMVLDDTTGKIVADIPGQIRNHGVALAPEVGRGFISDGKDGSVTVFALKDYRTLGKIKADNDADGIIYDPFSNKVLVACGDAEKLVVISADADLRVAKPDTFVALGGKPEFLATDDEGKVYVNLVDKNEVAVIDTKTMRVAARWSTAPGGSPTGMAIDPTHRLLFIGCRKPQKLIVMSTDDGKVLASLSIGAGVDADRFDNGDIFASCRDGSLWVAREILPGQFKIVQTVLTQMGSRTMGIDTRTHTLYLPAADFTSPETKGGRPTIKPGTFKILVVSKAKK